MISITKIADEINSSLKKTFLCDSEDDIQDLPNMKSSGDKACAAGSEAIVLSPSLKIYVLNNKNEWVLI